MRQVIGEFVVDRLRRSIVQGVLEDGAGYAGVFVVEGNEGIPRYEETSEGNGMIGEAHLGKGKLSAEIRFLKSRESLETAAAQALPLQSLVEDFEWRKRPLDEFGDRSRTLDVQDGEGGFRRVGRESGRKAVVSGRVRMEKS